MTKARVSLESVQVKEGQGIGEGDLELRIQVQEGDHNLFWPSVSGSEKVLRKGAVKLIDEEVTTYDLTSPKLSKRFTIRVEEVDKGTLGQNEEGVGTLTFELTPTMGPSPQSTDITLHRPNMQGKPLGKVAVTMTAQLA